MNQQSFFYLQFTILNPSDETSLEPSLEQTLR